MVTKPTRKRGQKPGQRGETSLARIAEWDLEVPADAANSVNRRNPRHKPCTGCRSGNPKLEPIPPPPK